MKIAFILLLCSISLAMAQTDIPGGYVSGTWTAEGSPYNVLGNITIHADSTLNIEPGVVVDFQNLSFLLVNGLLQAVGTESDSILFTGASWMGIDFRDAADSSHLIYCIVQNADDWAGPLYGGITCLNSNPVISHCRISNNTGRTELWGAGGIMLQNSNADISWCDISGNVVNNVGGATGGGIKIMDSHPVITGCNITGNDGYYRGGGIDMVGNSSLTIANCSITGNLLSSGSSGMGGGIAAQGSDLDVSECTISRNVGGLIGGGGAWISGGTAIFTSCVIDSNSMVVSGPDGAGGGIYADCDTLLVDRCTFIDNIVGEPSNYVGFSLHTEGSTALILVNSIIQGRGYPDRLIGLFGASASISFSDFYRYRDVFVGDLPPGLGELTGVNINGDSCDVYCNILLDPMFIDYPNGDFHLQENSPCIDAGDPDSAYDPDGTIADMGRFYYDQSAGIDDAPSAPPVRLSLSQNYPNPFNATTTISYSLPEPGEVVISIYNLLGQRVATVFQGKQEAGEHMLTCNATDFPSGVYFARLEEAGRSDSIKMVLLK